MKKLFEKPIVEMYKLSVTDVVYTSAGWNETPDDNNENNETPGGDL